MFWASKTLQKVIWDYLIAFPNILLTDAPSFSVLTCRLRHTTARFCSVMFHVLYIALCWNSYHKVLDLNCNFEPYQNLPRHVIVLMWNYVFWNSASKGMERLQIEHLPTRKYTLRSQMKVLFWNKLGSFQNEYEILLDARRSFLPFNTKTSF